ncbi:MAG: mucR [Rhodospirillaceae bacterium]|nr:MAG: mucR [Rhodospirillaceae bacterium]
MNLLRETARIVVSYVRSNPVPVSALTALLQAVYQTLAVALQELASLFEKPVPALLVKKSVIASHVVCLECGKKFKMLKRHLHIDHDLTIEEYRTRWQSPVDYPMVAPDYAERQSELAYRMGVAPGHQVEEKPFRSRRGAGALVVRQFSVCRGVPAFRISLSKQSMVTTIGKMRSFPIRARPSGQRIVSLIALQERALCAPVENPLWNQ